AVSYDQLEGGLMQGYVLRRLLFVPPMLFVISLFMFWLLNALPGSAALTSVGMSQGHCTECIRNFEKQFGLDRPFIVQYADWAWHAVRLDFGVAITDQKPIMPRIKERIGNTAELGLLTVLITVLIGVPIGLVSAIRPGSPVDYLVRLISVFGLSVPSFWLATLVITLPVIWWGFSPLRLHYVSVLHDPLQNLRIMIWPALVLAVGPSAYLARLTRSSMLDTLYSDFVRTARAKGLAERVVVLRHVFRSSVVTLLTVVGIQVGAILGGSIIAEQIFGI